MIFMQIKNGFTNYFGFAIIPLVIVHNFTICRAVADLMSYIPFKCIIEVQEGFE